MSRYLIEEKLGQGGMGVVYGAYDPELDRRIALKVFSLRSQKDPAMAHRRLQREAQALAQLSHPNVIAVHDVGRLDDDAFIAMERVEGRTLRQWLAARDRSIAEILQVFIAAGNGLRAAHRVGMIHRDFKPENVMLGRDRRVRVLDFGLARVVADDVAEPLGESLDSEPLDGESLDAESFDSGPGQDTHHGDPRPIDALAPTVEEFTYPSTQSLPGASRASQNGSEPAAPEAGTTGKRLLDEVMTRAGAVVGTPAYMAPEQHLGEPVTPRADQFSFCVTLHEALYGALPFGSGDAGERATRDAVLAGRVRPSGDRSKVPARLRRILLRGLQRDPAKRYPSMSALLGDLSADPRAAMIRAVAVGVVVLSIIVASWALVRDAGETPALCRDGESRLRGIWDDDAQSAVARRFSRSTRPHAAASGERVALMLQRYATGWITAYTDTCEATHVRGEQSPALLDLRMQCLSRRLGELSAFTAMLVHQDQTPGNETVIDNAIGAAGSLPDLAACRAEQAAMTRFAGPVDDEKRARFDAIEKELDRIRAMDNAGMKRQARPLAETAIERATALGHPSLIARAHYQRSALDPDSSKTESWLTIALEHAALAGDDVTSAQVLIAMTRTVGLAQSKFAESKRLARVAAAAIARAGNPPLLLAELCSIRASIAATMGDYDASHEFYDCAVEHFAGELGARHSKVADQLVFKSWNLFVQGAYQVAWDEAKRAQMIYQDSLPDDHPQALAPLLPMGLARYRQGRFIEAIDYFEEVLRAWEEAHGEDSVLVAQTLRKLAAVRIDQGDLDTARREIERAIAIFKARASRDDFSDKNTDQYIRLYIAEERHDEALRAQREVLTSHRQRYGDDHLLVARALHRLGTIRFAQRAYDDAERLQQEALASLEASIGGEHPAVIEILTDLARARLAKRQPDAALPLTERAVARLETIEGKPSDRARVYFTHAQALWADPDRRERAITAAESAQDIVAEAEGQLARELFEKIETWLARRSDSP